MQNSDYYFGAGAGVVAAAAPKSRMRILVETLLAILPLVDVITDFHFASSVYCKSPCRYDNVLGGYFYLPVFGFACIGALFHSLRTCALCFPEGSEERNREARMLLLGFGSRLNPLLADFPQMLFVCVDIHASDGTLSFEAGTSYFAA